MALDPNIRINLDRSVVLLVDDNPQALEALSAMVRGFGVRKQFKSGSGAEAMHYVKNQELDLIITDPRCPTWTVTTSSAGCVATRRPS